MVSPHDESKHSNRHRGECNELVTKDALLTIRSDYFVDNAHRGENHDVNRRVRIEPEQVLEQNRISTNLRREDSKAKRTFNDDKRECDSHDRCAKHDNHAGRIHRPCKQRHLEPSHPWRTHLMNRHDEVQARKDGRESGYKRRHNRKCDIRVRVDTGVWSVKRPSGVNASTNDSCESHYQRRTVDVERQQVEPWEREVSCA